MKLKSFTVKRYRSITRTEKISLARSTILVGPNNEGKSNILRALVLGMRILTQGRQIRGVGGKGLRYYIRGGYDWERDFPINLQDKYPQGKTELVLEFEPTKEELEQFRNEIKTQLSGTIPLRIEIARNGISVKVHKRGAGTAALSKKSSLIANFITKRIDLQHIKAVRTAESAVKVVTGLVERELSALEDNEEYIAAVEQISRLQEPILSNLSSSVQKTLVKFLPDVKGVSITIPTEERYIQYRRGCQIAVDDGLLTPLVQKGDGAQSLAALGLLRHASVTTAKSKNLVIAIEEPESHLHPNAIHELRGVLNELGTQNQLILTTHNPIFVDRRNMTNNILVQDRKARPAKSVDEVRTILGVKASDNLRNAELVLVVEGKDDIVGLSAIMAHKSSYLSSALANGTLAAVSMFGASNLSYRLSMLRDSLCLSHAFLDNDKAGKDAFDNARLQGLLTDREANFALCPNLNESELEDLYLLDLYQDAIFNRFGVSLNRKEFGTKKKWSARVGACFNSSGKLWSNRVETDVKSLVCELVQKNPELAVNEHIPAIDSLIQVLEHRLQSGETTSSQSVLGS